MIRLRLTPADLQRMRFAYSPLAEVAESLYLLASRRVPSTHRPWFEAVRGRLSNVDIELLGAVVSDRPIMPSFMFAGAGPTTTIEEQVRRLRHLPQECLRDELNAVWQGAVPAAGAKLLAHGNNAAAVMAQEVLRYWNVAIAPYWKNIRAALDDDVAYRAARLTRGGTAALLSDLHPDVSVRAEFLCVDRPRHNIETDLTGAGLLLVPSAFAWPNLVVDLTDPLAPSLTYPCRGVALVWDVTCDGNDVYDPLGELMGRTRATVLRSLAFPRCTTELAAELAQTPPSISQHLSILRRTGMAMSWRSGQRVLYRRTPLGDSVIAATSKAQSV